MEITWHLFPRPAQTAWEEIAMTGPRGSPISLSTGAYALPLSLEKLKVAERKLPCGKAPGPDLVHNEMQSVFVREDPEGSGIGCQG